MKQNKKLRGNTVGAEYLPTFGPPCQLRSTSVQQTVGFSEGSTVIMTHPGAGSGLAVSNQFER
jgi:hypothetical protein